MQGKVWREVPLRRADVGARWPDDFVVEGFVETFVGADDGGLFVRGSLRAFINKSLHSSFQLVTRLAQPIAVSEMLSGAAQNALGLRRNRPRNLVWEVVVVYLVFESVAAG